ncbi:DUF4412 domain-containing protein [Flavobacterium sp. TP390]|uniref:DUF4412 domain-containing protein n=1 Tax=Flavobacterium profundi TaxID=1774945 RepID=A0A6I4ILF7_9FLAO|nr:DUF4412 domain-containing protein [Flavobacterium profundi]MVO09479.1 DUF4412 domain-containing protein [Flavobacterium profundi]
MKHFCLTLLMTLFFSHAINAQFFKKLQDKAQQSMERALERKTDEKIDQTSEATMDTIFEVPKKIKKKSKKNKPETKNDNQNEFPGNIFTENDEIKYESKYIFPVTATIEMEDVTSNLKKTTMKQGYGKEALLTEIDKNGDPFIIDMKNETAIMLNVSNGTAQVMSLEWMEKIMGDQGISSQETLDVVPSVKKTGKTKMMNGYKCHEYTITYEKGLINAWYAPDVKFEYQDYLRGMSKLFSKKKEESPIQLLNTDYGYVMEMTFFNEQSKKQSSMKVIAIEEKVRMINMSLFTIQKL